MKARRTINFALAALLACQGAYGMDKSFSDAAARHVMANLIVDAVEIELRKLKRPQDISKLRLPKLSDADLKYLKGNLKWESPLKIGRLNRGLSITSGQSQITVTVISPFSSRVLINDKVEFSFEPGNSFQVQAELLKRQLESQRSAVLQLLWPQAEAAAFVPFLMGALAAAVFYPALTNVTAHLMNRTIIPVSTENYCKDKTPATSFTVAQLCADFFKWRDENRPAVPTSKPSNDRAKADVGVVKNACRTEKDPQRLEIRDPRTSLQTAYTIFFDDNNKATRIEEDIVWVSTLKTRIEYELDGDGKLVLVTDAEKLFLSRKKDHADRMDPEKFKLMEEFDQKLNVIAAFVKACDAKATVEAAADKSSSLLPNPNIVDVGDRPTATTK